VSAVHSSNYLIEREQRTMFKEGATYAFLWFEEINIGVGKCRLTTVHMEKDMQVMIITIALLTIIRRRQIMQ
jgi:hypothetical protein